MRLIPLSQGLFAQVDDADYDYLRQWKWYAQKRTNTVYATSHDKATVILMHRLILGLTDRYSLTDHIDHNGLNNQRSNLRAASYSQNNSNRRSQKNSLSKYLGVSLNIQKRKDRVYRYWTAHIGKNNKRIRLGYFKTEEDAARAYDEAAKVHHGEFASLNFSQ